MNKNTQEGAQEEGAQVETQVEEPKTEEPQTEEKPTPESTTKTITANVSDLKTILDEFATDKIDKKFIEIEKKALRSFRLNSTPENAEKAAQAQRFTKSANFLKAFARQEHAKLRKMSDAREMELKHSQVEGTDNLGGYLVPEEWEFDVNRYIYDFNDFRPNCTETTMKYEVKNLKSVLTRPTVSIVGESVAAADSTSVTFGQPKLTAETYLAIMDWSKELADDAEPNLLTLFQQLLAEAMAEREQEKFLDSVAAGSEGLLQVSGVTTVSLGVGEDSFTDITWDYLSDMQAALRSINKAEDKNAKYYMHPDIWNVLIKTKASTGGNYFLLASPQGGVTPMAWGREVVLSNSMPNLGDTAELTKFVIYSDLKRHGFIGNRKGMSLDVFNSGTVDSGGSAVNLIENYGEALRVSKRTAWTTALQDGIVVLATAATP